MNTNINKNRLTYREAGVDIEKEELALAKMRHWLEKTLSFRQHRVGGCILGGGYFANVIDIGAGKGLAISTDGVGTKILVARMMGKYNTIGIDCVAMNINDILCVGAEPIALVDYLAVREADPNFIEEIAKGLQVGAELAGITIPGGEIAQIPEMLADELPGFAFDLAGTAAGLVSLNQVILGNEVRPEDIIVGLQSSGIHSNGLTLARRVLFKEHKMSVDTYLEELGTTIGEELLKPTIIYARPIMEMMSSGVKTKALLHITSDGLLNLARIKSQVGFVIDYLPEPPPIFSLIQRCGNITDEEMFRVYNMGIGFVVIVSKEDVEKVLEIAMQHNLQGYVIGHTIEDPEKRVFIPSKKLVGKRNQFYRTS